MSPTPGKEYPLVIALKGSDKASGPLRAAAARIDAALGPLKRASGPLGTLGSRLSAAGAAAKNLAGKMALLGGAAAGAAGLVGRALVQWAGAFDDLNDSAQRLGLTVDALAQLKYAAKQSGIDDLESSLDMFSKGVGQAQAGTGRLAAYLKKSNPELLKQIQGAKGTEEAFGLMADAVAKIENPAERSALVVATFGNPKMVGLLSQGRAGVEGLKAEYFALAGSQQAAVTAGGRVDTAMNKLNASFDGVKAQLMTGLGPAIADLSGRLSKLLADPETRAKVAQWAKDFGEKLPGRIQRLIDALKSVAGVVKDVWNMLGGAKGALVALLAVKLAPLALSLGGLVGQIAKLGGGLTAAGTAAGGAATAVVAALAAVTAGAAYLGAKEKAEREEYYSKRPKLRKAVEAMAGKGNATAIWARPYQALALSQHPELAEPERPQLGKLLTSALREKGILAPELNVLDVVQRRLRRGLMAPGVLGDYKVPSLLQRPADAPPIMPNGIPTALARPQPRDDKLAIKIKLEGATRGVRTYVEEAPDTADVDMLTGPQMDYGY